MARVRKRLTLKSQRPLDGYRLEMRPAGGAVDLAAVGSILDELEPPTPNDLLFIVPRRNDGEWADVTLDDVRLDGILALEELLNVPFDGAIDQSIIRYVGRWGLLGPVVR